MIYFDVEFDDDMVKSVLLLSSEDGQVLGGLSRFAAGAVGVLDLKSEPNLQVAYDNKLPMYLTLQYEIDGDRMYASHGTISETKLKHNSILLKLLRFNPRASL